MAHSSSPPTRFALLNTLLLFSQFAHHVSGANYTVYSSVIFARTGERTPFIGMSSETTHITAFGAHQMINLGMAFHNRYLGSSSNVMQNMAREKLDGNQVDIAAIDAECTAVSALAFMQGFYPPTILTNTSTGSLDPTSFMSDNTYLNYPMEGYSYPIVRTLSEYEPESIYITGGTDCLARRIESRRYYSSPQYQRTAEDSEFVYQAVGQSKFLNTEIPLDQWSYSQAYNLYDYVSYMYNHNSSVKDQFDDPNLLGGKLDALAALASQSQWAQLGNLSVYGSQKGDKILAVAGRTLAARVLGSLIFNMRTSSTLNKLNLMVGEFPPMVSLFALMGLADFNTNFRTIPPYGSALAFELFSHNDNGVSPSGMPDESQLYVRFVFRNGSDPTSRNSDVVNPEFQSYPIFGRGPSGTEVRWDEFKQYMSDIMVDRVDDWCKICSAHSLFCAAFVQNGAFDASGSRSKLSAPVAGAVGAIVTLAVMGLLAAGLVFLCGMRLRREPDRKRSSLAGIRGSAKLASDPDLHLPNNAAPTGTANPQEGDGGIVGAKGHERVGSWELKSSPGKSGKSAHARFESLGSTVAGRPSFEEDGLDPFQAAPARPRESV